MPGAEPGGGQRWPDDHHGKTVFHPHCHFASKIMAKLFLNAESSLTAQIDDSHDVILDGSHCFFKYTKMSLSQNHYISVRNKK